MKCSTHIINSASAEKKMKAKIRKLTIRKRMHDIKRKMLEGNYNWPTEQPQ